MSRRGVQEDKWFYFYSLNVVLSIKFSSWRKSSHLLFLIVIYLFRSEWYQ